MRIESRNQSLVAQLQPRHPNSLPPNQSKPNLLCIALNRTPELRVNPRGID